MSVENVVINIVKPACNSNLLKVWLSRLVVLHSAGVTEVTCLADVNRQQTVCCIIVSLEYYNSKDDD